VLVLVVVTSLGQKVQEGLECNSPIEATLGRTISSTNPTTGTSASPACGMTNDLWFSVKSKCSSLIEFNLCSSNFDTVVAIYDDTEGEGCIDGEIQSSHFLGCNDDSPSQCPSNTASSFMTWQSNLNQRFLIRVGGFRGSTNSSGKIVLDINCAGEHQLEDDIVVVPAVLDAGATTKYVVKPANYRDLVTNFALYSYDGNSFAPLVANVSEPQIITESQIQSQGTFSIVNEQLSYTATSILLDDHTYQVSLTASYFYSFLLLMFPRTLSFFYHRLQLKFLPLNPTSLPMQESLLF
jgi:hypothetical protein